MATALIKLLSVIFLMIGCRQASVQVIVVGYIQTAVTLFESDGVAQLTVAITAPSQTYEIRSSFFLLVNTMTETATAPGDHASLTNLRLGPFNNSVRQLSFNVTIVNDNIPEDNEMFTVSLTLDPADLGNRVRVSPEVATVMIQDNDGVRIWIEPPRNRAVIEGINSTVRYCVVIAEPGMATPIQRSGFSVCVSTVDGTAKAGQDYQPVTNMTLGPLWNIIRRQCFNVNILNNTWPEDTEDFMIRVQFCPGEPRPKRVDINPQTGTITIIDDDVITVGYALTNVIVLESDGVAQLTVVISMPPGRVPIETSFYLRVNTIDGTAKAPGDYGSLTNFRIGPFNNSMRQLSFNVTIRNDIVPEDDEMFTVSLTLDTSDQARLGNRVMVSPEVATVMIQDNDGVRIWIEPPRNRAVIEGLNSTVEYCVVIAEPSMAAPIQRSGFSVCVSTVDGTAKAGQDYQPVTNMTLGPLWNIIRRQCFNVNILNNTWPEDTEDFMIRVQFCPGEPRPERVDINPQTGTITIIDDDVITVGYALTNVTVLESDGVAQLAVVISMPPGRVPIETLFYLRVNTIDGTDKVPGDYGSLTNFRIGPFNNSVHQLFFDVSIVDDNIPEDDEMFNVRLTLDPADQSRLGNRVIVSPDVATVTVIEDNDRVTIAIEPPKNRTVIEGMNSTVEYCVVIAEPGMAAPIQRSGFSVCVSTVDGTAKAGQDYQSVTNIRLGTFGNSIRRQCFNVNILNDTQSENPEYFMIQVQFCQGETFERVDIDPSTGTTTVMDDDSVLVGFEQSSYTVDENVGQFQVCVVLTIPPQSDPPNRTFFVRISTRPDTAGSNDFTAITQDVGPFSNTQQRRCLFVEITNDVIPEETENFFFDLTTRPREVLARVTIRPAVAEVTINGNNLPNNRTAITISMSAVQAPSLGQSLRIQCTCIVSETVGGLSARPVLQWLNGDGSDVVVGDGITMDGPNFQSTQTTLTLVFNALRTSHAEKFICRGSLSSLALPSPLVKTENYIISIQIPTPTVTISSPSVGTPYAGSRFILQCTMQLNQTVDSPVAFTVFWRRSGVLILNDTRTTVYNVVPSGSHTYLSRVVFSTLSLTLDSGQYTCEASVSANPPSPYITGSFSATSTAYSLTVKRPMVSITEIALLCIGGLLLLLLILFICTCVCCCVYKFGKYTARHKMLPPNHQNRLSLQNFEMNNREQRPVVGVPSLQRDAPVHPSCSSPQLVSFIDPAESGYERLDKSHKMKNSNTNY